MSGENNQHLARLGRRIRELSGQIVEHTNVKRKRQNITFGIGVVVAIAVFFSLYNLTLQSRKLDAEAITQIGRHEIEQRLPITRKKIEAHLQQEAPHLVDQGFRTLLAQLPNLRIYILRDLNARLDHLSRKFETNMAAMLATNLEETQRRLDAAYPNLNDREKVEMLVAKVAADFNTRFTTVIDVLYPEYSMEVARLSKQIAYLHNHRLEELTKAEQIKKQIIETMVQLSLMETAKQ